MTIELHGRYLRGWNVEDTEPVSGVVSSKWCHALCACVVVGNIVCGTPVFGFLPQCLRFHLSHAHLRAYQDCPGLQLGSVGNALPVVTRQFDDLATIAFQLCGTIIAVHILRRPRERIDESPPRQRTTRREVSQDALPFGLG
mgnify:CR=1 FL=1